MNEYLKKFADNLRTLRTEKGLSYRDMEKLTGISRSAIHQYENCKRDPQLSVIKKLSEVFDEDINWIVGDVDTRRIKKIAN
jgi:transcriptional regulator with XRE-family HTH domain